MGDLIAEELRQRLADALAGRGEFVCATALAPGARLLALAAAARQFSGTILLITPDDASARRLAVELEPLLSEEPALPVLRLPALDADPYRGLPAHPAIAATRVATLDRLVFGGPQLVVAPVTALLVPVPDADSIRAWAREIAVGSRMELDDLARDAVQSGYRVVDTVTAPGDLARRGGLFDIWPPQEESPLRVELFGDFVESVRRFDAASQRTIARTTGLRLLPAREAPLTAEHAERLLERLVGRARHVLDDLPVTETSVSRWVEEALAGLEAAPRLYRSDLVALHALVDLSLVVWEADECAEKLERAFQDLEQGHRERTGEPLPSPAELFVIPEQIAAALRRAPLTLSALALSDDPTRQTLDLGGRPARRYDGRTDEWARDLEQARAAGRAVVLVLKTAGRRDRLRDVLDEQQIEFRVADNSEGWAPNPGEIVLASGTLDAGVEFGHSGPIVLGEHDLFGEDPPPPPPRRRRGTDAFLSDLRDLKEEDLVIHVDHGVARYVGLSNRPVTGEELLVLQYAGGDRLFVPVSRLDLIQKYSGGENAIVPLDRLGGPGWDRRRHRVKKAVEKIAAELLELYAKRKAVRAQPFSADTVWQKEFDGAFPHELTYDQQTALADIRADLRSGKVMDRLLCGDVGYGKTEVALRAAFQIAQAGGQVAMLVPTTVLVIQHLATVRARMAAWPIRVEAVSRLHKEADNKRVLELARQGQVDIVIGTHRLLSADVRFKKLGLLIIDEEQRFGVRHKEAIKKLSLGVHTLALSATPIPRTLQMSMAGVRDMSVIETPPRNRLAIQTLLAPWSPSLVAAAIRNELRRGGQIYFITPRVQGIEEVTAQLRELVPEATIAWAHGQLPEGELEKAMLAFVRGTANVLVATTIIENGLDISRANTIIIDKAHRFGLAQLYQMRGRVGRSDVRAYAYLFVPSRRDLTPEARQRLAALVEFSDLGSGFRIAALDLEIRGAGELLGSQQSGHMAAVGFELYVKMLEEAVLRLRGKELPHVPEPVTINLGVPAHLPETLIPIPGHRLAIYKRLTSADTLGEVQTLLDETVDRYGRLPEAAQNLFRSAELRVTAALQGAVQIDWADDAVAIRFGPNPQIDPERVLQLVRRDRNVRLSPGGTIRVRMPDVTGDRLTIALRALQRLANA